MIDLESAKNIIVEQYPESKLLAILETDKYYICHLSDDTPAPIRKAVNKVNGTIEILGLMDISAEMNTTHIKEDHKIEIDGSAE